MSPKGHIEHDLELGEDIYLDFRVQSDEMGNPVVSHISIGFRGTSIPQGGLTASVLRDIRISDLLIKWFEENPKSFLGQGNEKTLWRVITQEWKSRGSKGIQIEYYAALAYFYVKTSEINPNNPTATLASKMNISVKTLQTRLAQARKLGLLSLAGASSGKASGTLTSKARQLIKEKLDTK